MALRSLARSLCRAPVVTGGPRMSPPSGSRSLTSQGKREQDKGFDQWPAEYMKRSRDELKESRRSEMSGLVLGGVTAVGFISLHTIVCLGAGFCLGVFFTLEELRKAVRESNQKAESSPQGQGTDEVCRVEESN